MRLGIIIAAFFLSFAINANAAAQEKSEVIVVKKIQQENRDGTATLLVDRPEYAQKDVVFTLTGDAGAAAWSFVKSNLNKDVYVTYIVERDCPFCITSIEPIKPPSFDCSKAATPTEKAICSSPRLSTLDGNLASSYKKAQEKTTDLQQLKATQIDWVKNKRNPCGANIDCLSNAYSGRINELNKMKSVQSTGVVEPSALGMDGRKTAQSNVQVSREQVSKLQNQTAAQMASGIDPSLAARCAIVFAGNAGDIMSTANSPRDREKGLFFMYLTQAPNYVIKLDAANKGPGAMQLYEKVKEATRLQSKYWDDQTQVFELNKCGDVFLPLYKQMEKEGLIRKGNP